MAQSTLRAVLWGVAYLPFFLLALLLVTDVEVLGRHFYREGPFNHGALLGDLWPGSILKALAILATFAALSSEWFSNYLGRLQFRGSTFVLLFFLLLLVACALIIDHYQLYYPDVFEGDRVLSAMKLSSLVIPLPFIALLLNESFARPAPTVLVIGLWVLLFAVVKIWTVHTFTGELDLMSPVTMWFEE